jgi:hypothetical protein
VAPNFPASTCRWPRAGRSPVLCDHTCHTTFTASICPRYESVTQLWEQTCIWTSASCRQVAADGGRIRRGNRICTGQFGIFSAARSMMIRALSGGRRGRSLRSPVQYSTVVPHLLFFGSLHGALVVMSSRMGLPRARYGFLRECRQTGQRSWLMRLGVAPIPARCPP